MKIALSFPGCHRRGGVERVMVECANFLAGRGHQVSVIAADFDDTVLASGIEKIHVDASSRVPLLRLSRFATTKANAIPIHRLTPTKFNHKETKTPGTDSHRGNRGDVFHHNDTTTQRNEQIHHKDTRYTKTTKDDEFTGGNRGKWRNDERQCRTQGTD